MAMIPGAEASKAAIMINDGQGLRSSRGIGRTQKYGQYDRLLECLQVTYPDAMAMAMVMMSTEHKPPSMPPSQDEAHTMIVDFTEITVSNSDNDIHLLRVTSARLDGRMQDIPEVEIWSTVSIWMFILSLFFYSVYFLTSLLLWISAQYKWGRHRF